MTQSNSIAVSVSDRLNDEIREALSKEKVNFKVPSNWYQIAVQILGDLSPIALGINVAQFKDLVRKLGNEQRLNCFEFAGINNKIEEKTPNELNQSLSQYIATMELVEKLVKEWNEQTDSIRKDIIDNMMDKAKNIQRANL